MSELTLLDVEMPPPADRDVRAVWAFESWGKQVLSFLVRLVGDEHEAEALAQEVYCRLLDAKGDFATGALVRGWLFRVARNLALDHHKKRRPRLVTDVGMTERDPLDSFPAGADGAGAEQKDYVLAMRRALDRLPDLYRSTLVLRFLEQWSYEDIAAVENVSESALRTRVQKGIDLLRRELGLVSQAAATGGSGRTRSVDNRSGTAK